MTDDIIEVHDVMFAVALWEEGKVQAMHTNLYKAFSVNGRVTPVITFDAETTQQAKAQYVMMRERGEIEVVDDIYEP